mgnify:CR=1 FL=1
MKKTLILTLLMILFNHLNAENLNSWMIPKSVPFPKDNPITKEKVELGKLLFFDNVSCFLLFE